MLGVKQIKEFLCFLRIYEDTRFHNSESGSSLETKNRVTYRNFILFQAKPDICTKTRSPQLY